ncbi:MAG TPA: hypothetical protein GXX28_06740 [Firmicutes bacterium]|nr:hypothetical protein [Bacillota bacterium]
MSEGEKKPARERFGKCPVEAQLTEEAVQRVLSNEYLCTDEYGVGVGDPQTGWWSVNWVNTPAMGPGPVRREGPGRRGAERGNGSRSQESEPAPAK